MKKESKIPCLALLALPSLAQSTEGSLDYELLDSGYQQRLERFGPYIISRPDPQLIWQPRLPESDWEKADAAFARADEGGGRWEFREKMPERWMMRHGELSFYARLTPFKHTGIFPEQALHWDWMTEKIRSARQPVRVLNLFGYTGIASLACAAAGAEVTHVDASYPSIGWARENQKASGLESAPIRWILDDAIKFVQRERRRGASYEAIVMDPPAYGRGPKGETWSFNAAFPQLMEDCVGLLSESPLFFLVNAYAISSSALTLGNVLADHLPAGSIQCGELCLTEKSGGRLLSTGVFARWES